MARSGITLLSFAVLLALFEIGSCRRCYQCNSQTDPACNDPFVTGSQTDRFIVDCDSPGSLNYNRDYLRSLLPSGVSEGIPGSARTCHKIVLQSGTVARACLDANYNDLNRTCRLMDSTARQSPSNFAIQLRHCSVCDKDNCNAAGGISASVPLAILALVASYLYYKQ